jgi:hypothetical protein
MRRRHRHRIHLHDVRSRCHVLEVIFAVGIRHRVAAIFQVHAHAFHAALALREIAASTFSDAAHDDRALAEEFFS